MLYFSEVNSFLKNKLKRENIRNNLQTLLPTNLGGRAYFKRMHQEMEYDDTKKKKKRKRILL